MNDEEYIVRRVTFNSPHVKSEHVTYWLNHTNPNLRRFAAHSPHFGQEHMEQARNHKDPAIRWIAKQKAEERGWNV
jgi:hypothetical protein